MSVIAHADDVTPAWLAEVLARAGFDGTVEDVTWESIGAGQVGENVRFTLDAGGSFPRSLVGKLPSTDPVSKETGIALENYAREVFFYREIAQTVDIQTPAVYATEFDEATHDFIVLMEDLAPGVQIDQMSEASTDQAAKALEELAKLQGPRWGDGTLREIPLLNRARPPDAEPLYVTFERGFIDRYRHRLMEHETAMVAAVGNAHAAGLEFAEAQTLVHVDYRLDNMIIGGPHPLTVLDWQSIGVGCALQDASYFMGTSLEPGHRARDEQALLRHYLEVLRSYGVDLAWDDCWRLYRANAAAGLNMAVIASMIVGETERGNDMFMTMAQRSIAMCNELDTLELLPG